MIQRHQLWSARIHSTYVTEIYPEHPFSWDPQDKTLVDEKADTDFNLVFQAIKAVRSLAVQYNLQKDVDGAVVVSFLHPVLTAWDAVYLLTSSDSEASILSAEIETIRGLTKVLRSAKVVRQAADVPPGCGSSLLSADSALHIDVAVSFPSTPPPLLPGLQRGYF